MLRRRPSPSRLAAISMAVLVAGASGPAAAGEAVVRYAEGQVSAAFNQATGGEVVSAIEARTGLRFVLPPALRDRRVSGLLAARPLDRAIRALVRVLGGAGYTAVYDAQGRPRRVVVLAPGVPSPRPPTRPAVTSPWRRAPFPARPATRSR